MGATIEPRGLEATYHTDPVAQEARRKELVTYAEVIREVFIIEGEDK